MRDGNRARRASRAVRVLAVIFMILAGHRVLTLALPLFAPQYMVMELSCGSGGCTVGPSPFLLLSSSEGRHLLAPDPAVRARYMAHLEAPELRLRLFGTELIARLPEVALFFCIAMALWGLARPGGDSGLRGVAWLVRAAMAAVALAVVAPVAAGIRDVMLLTGVVPDDRITFYVDLDVVQRNLLLAAAAWAAAWSIRAGLRARAELSSII